MPRPTAITLDIDDSCDPVHGHQQLSLCPAGCRSPAELATLRQSPLKIGIRVVDKAARIHLASACPTPPCSACWRDASPPRAPDRRAPCPENPSLFNPNLDTANLQSRHRKVPNAIPAPS